MKTGTHGFIADRLKQARKARSLSGISLAKMVGISRQALSQYETNKSTPSPEVLARMAKALNLPPIYFTRTLDLLPQGTIFYRSMSSATKTARKRAESRFSWMRSISLYVAQFVTLPRAEFPDLCLPNDPLLLSDRLIDDAASSLREYWGLRMNPISNMVLLLENKGAVVARDQLGAQTLDSLSEFVHEEERPYVLIGTDKGTSARWRFDAAHELGHAVMHASANPKSVSKPELHKLMEDQAHRFAASFLLPLESFGDELFSVSLDAFLALKPRWKTSIAMMIRRARDAGFLSPDAERGMWVNYARRGWRRGEPYDDTIEIEEPRLLRRSFELLLDHGLQSTADILSSLALSDTDVESLSGLPRGFLQSYGKVGLRQLYSNKETWRSNTEFAEPSAPIIQLHRNKGITSGREP